MFNLSDYTYTSSIITESVNYIIGLFKTVFTLCSTYTIDSLEWLGQQPVVQRIALNGLLCYSTVCVMSVRLGQRIYRENELIRIPCDWISWFYEHIQVISSRKRYEPSSHAWLSVSTLIKVPRLNEGYPYLHELPGGSIMGTRPLETASLLEPFTPKYYFIETYENFEEGPMHIASDMGEHAKRRFENKMDQDGECSETTNTVIIMKLRCTENNGEATVDKYIVRLQPKISANLFVKNNESMQNIPITETTYHLLSVEYCHPSMKDSITLKIPRSMMLIGNQLLSRAFVRRSLEYQSESYVFDEHYTIQVMDAEIKQYSLNSNQYIQLTQDDCIIGMLDT